MEDLYWEHEQHFELIPNKCSECDKEVRAIGDAMIKEEQSYKCSECKDTGVIEVIRWVDTDTSYPELVNCPNCNQE